MNIFLTQYDGAILGPIAKLLGYILEGIYSFFGIFGIYNIGLCIIFFTFIVNGLMIPLTLKQQKFSKLNSLMAPEIQAIQAKYKNKRDQESIQKMQMEQQAVYNKYGVSPTAGCLPMLISLPILFALYRVIYNIPAYVPEIKEIYVGIIEKVYDLKNIDSESFANCIASFVKDGGGKIKLTKGLDLVSITTFDGKNLLKALIEGINKNGKFNEETTNYIVDVFIQFKGEHWDALKNIDIIKNSGLKISSSYNQLRGIYNFCGMNIMETPAFNDVTISIPILAVVTQFISNKIVMSNTTNNNDSENDPTANSMKTMNNIMPFMSGIFCFMFPIGVGLYWVAGSLFRIIQGIFINLYFNKVGIESIAAKNIEKRNKKLEKKGIDPNSTKMQEIANTRTSSIKSSANHKHVSSNTNNNKGSKQEYYVNRNINKNSSIADIANMLNSNYESNSSDDETEE